MRDCTKGMVEQHARSKGVRAITIEICNEGIELAKASMEEAMKNPAKMEEILAKFMPKKPEPAQPTA
jgi:predicted N-formylglutamate amidohydrolase